MTFLGISPSELNGNKSSGTYAIDGAAPTGFVIPGHGSVTEYNQVLFQTPEVESGQHSLVVTYQGNSNQAPLVLDWLYVVNGSVPQLSGSPSSSSTPSSSSAAADQTFTPTFPSTTPKHTVSTGIIVGAAIGGIIVLAVLGFLIWFLSRRHSGNTRDIQTIDEFEQLPRPYADHPPTTVPSSWMTSRSPDGSSSEPSFHPGFSLVYDSAPYAQPHIDNDPFASKHQLLPVNPAPSLPSAVSVTDTSHSEPVVVLHEDSGLRVTQAPIVDVPPTYTPS